MSYLIARFCYERLDRREAAIALGTLAGAAAVFLAWKSSLGFGYSGRGDYMLTMMRQLLVRNLRFAPIALAPVVAWFTVMRPAVRRGTALLCLWISLLAIVSLLTADVTRVMTIVTLPIVLVGALRDAEDGSTIPSRRAALLALLIFAIPPYSWAGLDWSVWGNFLNDLHTWGIVG